MGYKSRLKQLNRVGQSCFQERKKESTIYGFKAKVLDDRSRRSYILLDITIPQYEISFTGWFHLFSTDGEYIKAEYAFTPEERGLASHDQLKLLLEKVTEVAGKSYIYMKPLSNSVVTLVDRYNELDNSPLYATLAF